MKILELENRTGLDRATIRYYEREGLIAPRRGENGYRDYTDAEAESLLKIRLLRQLGMTLYQISQLQAGNEDFSKAMAQQIETLSRQIQEGKRAREVCSQILSAGVDYQHLDAGYYLRVLEEPEPQHFREKLPRECHPWRRFFARMLDVWLVQSLVQFFLVVVIRIRPVPRGILLSLLWMACAALFVPIEAYLVSRWGETPGKWILGIRLESREDRRLTWEEALKRSWGAYAAGMGYGIPFVELFCMEGAYCTLTGRSRWRFARYDEVSPPADVSWDDGVETSYSPKKGKWLAALLAGLFLLNNVSAADSIKPTYRGDQLTVREFARNYNAVLAVTGSNLDRLEDDGSVQVVENGTVTIYVSGTPENKYADFGYETENDFITGITYENTWTNVTFLNPVGDACFQSAVTFLMSKEHFRIKDMREFEALWESNLGKQKADFSYHGLRIQWDMELENCEMHNWGVAKVDDTLEARVSLYFRIEP